jgi:hypothetical protein
VGETQRAFPRKQDRVMPPEKPLDFRTEADECVRLAKVAPSPEVRAILLYVASRWRALADKQEGATDPTRIK